MPLLSPFEELAMRKGREEGREEGREQTQQEILALLLETRFGTLEPELMQTLTTLSVQQVKALILAQVGFTSKDNLTNWLHQPPA